MGKASEYISFFFFRWVDDLTWYTIFFSYYFFHTLFVGSWTHRCGASTGMSTGKKWKNSVIVCARILFRNVDMCYNFFFSSSQLCCCASSTTAQSGSGGVGTSPGTPTEAHRPKKKNENESSRYKNIIFVRRRGNKLKSFHCKLKSVVYLDSIDAGWSGGWLRERRPLGWTSGSCEGWCHTILIDF